MKTVNANFDFTSLKRGEKVVVATKRPFSSKAEISKLTSLGFEYEDEDPREDYFILDIGHGSSVEVTSCSKGWWVSLSASSKDLKSESIKDLEKKFNGKYGTFKDTLKIINLMLKTFSEVKILKTKNKKTKLTNIFPGLRGTLREYGEDAC